MMELLAPAGSIEIAYTALNSGADAIYFAGKSFGARASASNFTENEIIEITKYAHERDKSVYVTVNTVIFEDEIREVVKFLDFLYLNDVDGVIVQDLGLCKIIKERYPSLELHASTQMNIHTVNDAKVLKDLGFKRVVVSRETPIEVVKEIKDLGIEVEVFIHGALCVSYSGNCFFSSIVGKRSGNRGRCAQPCRLEYSLLKDSEKISEGYLLSPKELCTIEMIDEYKKIGVDSLKIEGRLKRKEYVSETVLSYRRAIDKKDFVLNKEMKNLKIAYNRGFTKGFIFNENNNYFTNTSFQNHQGILIGNVASTFKDKANIKLTDDLSFGDSIRIVGKKTDGLTINQMYVDSKLVKSAKAGDLVTVKVHEEGLGGAKVYLTSSIKQEIEASNIKDEFKVKVSGHLYTKGNEVFLSLSDGKNESIASCPYLGSPNDNSIRIKEQLKKMGGTIFELDSLEISNPFILVPIKDLNELRRQVVSLLLNERSIRYKDRVIKKTIRGKLDVTKTNELLVKVRTKEQLIEALKYDVLVFIEDYQLYLEYKDQGVKYYTSRVFNNNYMGGALTESLANMKDSYSSVYNNVTNSFSAYFLTNLGAKCVGLSIELAKDDISELVLGFKKNFGFEPNLYMMVYGYYEVMISKYCPIQKANEVEKKNCNLCLKNHYELVDRMGYHFPIIKGEGCYTKILNSRRVQLLPKLDEIKDMEITNFLLDFSIEDKDEVGEIIKMYLEGLKGNKEARRLSDVTYGHYNEGVL